MSVWMHGPREAARQAALLRYGVLDQPEDPDLSAIAELAAQICGTPYAAINLTDERRQWQAAVFGGTPGEFDRADAFCSVVVEDGASAYTADALTDERFAASPFATGGIAAYRTYAAAPLLSPEGHVLGTLCVFDEKSRPLAPYQRRALEVLAEQIVTLFELRLKARSLGAVTARFSAAFEHAPIGMALVDHRGRWTLVNRSLALLLAHDTDRLLGTGVAAVVYEEDLPSFVDALARLTSGEQTTLSLELRFVRRDGPTVWAEVSGSVVAGSVDDELEIVLQIEDVTARRAATEAMEHRATHDPLTGLPNRVILADRLATGMERLRREEGELTVLVIDLDGFKAVNDARGHAMGDRLLVEVARRLRRRLRAADSVVRMGGDEFVIVCEERSPSAEGRRIGERIVAILSEPVVIDGIESVVGASVGVASTVEPMDPQVLLARADAALYAAKAAGSGIVELDGGGVAERVVGS